MRKQLDGVLNHTKPTDTSGFSFVFRIINVISMVNNSHPSQPY